MTPEPAGIRAFVALELNEACRRTLGEMQRLLQQSRAQVRWMRPETMHLTLFFLGLVSWERIPQVTAALDVVAAAHPPFRFSVGGVGSFGSRNRLRVLWAGVPDPPQELLLLQSDLTAKIQPPENSLEKRPFKPHLTLGRMRGPRNLSALSAAIREMTDSGRVEVPVNRVVLMQSILKTAGAEHHLLHASPLASGH